MEAARGSESTAGLASLGEILPPRIEDAGLENAALSPNSISRAFLKAAASAKNDACSIHRFRESLLDLEVDDASHESAIGGTFPVAGASDAALEHAGSTDAGGTTSRKER